MSNIGYCKYCGNGRVVELPEGVSQEALDQEASATCNCYRAMEARKKRLRGKSASHSWEKCCMRSIRRLRSFS